MLTKQEQRAVKDLVIAACHAEPDLIGVPVWYVPNCDTVHSSVNDLAKCLYKRRMLPWPAAPSICIYNPQYTNAEYIACAPSTEDDLSFAFWSMVYERGNPRVFYHRPHSYDADKELTSIVIFALAAMSMPCGYIVKHRSSCGFGTGALRRETRERPIFSIVPYERLYREVRSAGLEPREVHPHQRRGHMRYLWKAAGVDRHALPRTAAERLMVALEHNVRMVRVPPTWVGEREWSDGAFTHEIQIGEFPMNPCVTRLFAHAD